MGLFGNACPLTMLGEVEGRLGEVEGRLGEVEAMLDEVEGRLGELEGRLDEVEAMHTRGYPGYPGSGWVNNSRHLLVPLVLAVPRVPRQDSWRRGRGHPLRGPPLRGAGGNMGRIGPIRGQPS